jgi:hypothetical protein
MKLVGVSVEAVFAFLSVEVADILFNRDRLLVLSLA